MSGRLRTFWYDNSLSIVLLVLFAGCFLGHSISGFLDERANRMEQGQPPPTFGAYLTSGPFLESVFENWESEFLQMALFVVLTVSLRQKGSSESKSLDEPEPVDQDPRAARLREDTPWPVRRGGLLLTIYEHSLSLALLAVFAFSFSLHALTGHHAYNAEREERGLAAVSLKAYVSGPRFWFESFQNWQSEFLAVWAIVVFSIYLRERGSAQSKAVAAAHSDTGE